MLFLFIEANGIDKITTNPETKISNLLNENAELVVCGCEDDAGVDDVWGTAKPVKELVVVPAAEVELVKPNPVAAEVAGVLLVADVPTPKEGKVVVEAAAEDAGALVAAGVEEGILVVVVVVATENTAGDVVDAGAVLAVEGLNPIED